MVSQAQLLRPESGEAALLFEGDQVLVGDVSSAKGEPGTIAYEVLCRRHYRAELTARKAGVEHISRQPLPFEE